MVSGTAGRGCGQHDRTSQAETVYSEVGQTWRKAVLQAEGMKLHRQWPQKLSVGVSVPQLQAGLSPPTAPGARHSGPRWTPENGVYNKQPT